MLLPAPPHVYIKTWGMDTNKLACVHTLIVFQCKIKIYIKKKNTLQPPHVHPQPETTHWNTYSAQQRRLSFILVTKGASVLLLAQPIPRDNQRNTGIVFFFCDSFLRSKKSYKKRKQKDFIVVKTCVSFTVQCWNLIWKLLHILSNLCRIICLHLGSNIQCECLLGRALEIFWEICKVNSISRKW